MVSHGALAVRRFDRATVTQLAGTEGASLPFFSPNGQWVAYFAAHMLQKIALEGGAPMVLCDAPVEGGGTWSDDESIVANVGAEGGLSDPSVGRGTATVDGSKVESRGQVAANASGRKERAIRGHKRERAGLTTDTDLE